MALVSNRRSVVQELRQLANAQTRDLDAYYSHSSVDRGRLTAGSLGMCCIRCAVGSGCVGDHRLVSGERVANYHCMFPTTTICAIIEYCSVGS